MSRGEIVFNQEEQHEEKPGKKKLEEISDKTSEPLAQARTFFSPFPSYIAVDLLKISIREGTFFYSEDVTTIPIEDVEEISVEKVIFWATLKIKHKKSYQPLAIKALDVKQALEVKGVISGLMTLVKEKVKLSELEPEEDKEKIESIDKATDLQN